MKLQRYDPPRRYTKPVPWIKCDGGDWCDSDDVDRLEADHKELIEAAKDIIARWDSSLWKYDMHTGVLIDRLRKAIEKSEEVML